MYFIFVRFCLNRCRNKQISPLIIGSFWNEGFSYSSNFRADGRVAIVTGASGGVGLQTARGLAAHGARVYLACRSEPAALAARDEIIRCTGNKDVHYLHLDLTRLASVREFVREFREREPRLDVLVNNAAVLRADETEQHTVDGLELHMAVNYYGAFMLSALLMDRLRAARSNGITRQPSRIVNVASDGHGLVGLQWCKRDADAEEQIEQKNDNYFVGPFQRYLQSKLAMVVFTKELGRRMDRNEGVTVNCVHPGWNFSELDRHLGLFGRCMTRVFALLFFKSSWSAAQTSLYAALDVNLQNVSGEYFAYVELPGV